MEEEFFVNFEGLVRFRIGDEVLGLLLAWIFMAFIGDALI